MGTALSPARAGGMQGSPPRSRWPGARTPALCLCGVRGGASEDSGRPWGPALLRYPAFLIRMAGATDGQERLGGGQGLSHVGRRQGFPRKRPSQPSPCWMVQKRQGLHPGPLPGAGCFRGGWSHLSLMDSLRFQFSSKSTFSHFLLPLV